VSLRAVRSIVAGVLTAILMAACGGSSNSPTPVTPQPPPAGPPPAGPSVNVAPVVERITADVDRTEVNTDVTLTASVKDEETAIDQLKFEWKADIGAFSGEGASVKWRAPADIPTPADTTITLTVTETYGAPDSFGVRPQNVTTAAAPPIRVHNSPKELGDMSVLFLSDFATSSTSTSTCLRNFSDSCPGKAEEKRDIDNNREYLEILSSSLNLRSVTVASSRLTAKMSVACAFTSRIVKCPPPGPDSSACVVGSVESVRGDCTLTGVYEQKRWWLCDSHFNGAPTAAVRRLFGVQ
jgi:hypothetical protein